MKHRGEPLVLIHGWGFSGRVWDGFTPYLASRWCTLALDLPGCGRSPSCNTYSLDGLTDTFVRQVPKRAVWVAWSLGGLVALNAAHRYAERVSILILIASTPCFTVKPGWPWGVSRKVFRQFEQQLRTDSEKTLRGFVTLLASGAGQRNLMRELHRQIGVGVTQEALLGGLQILAESDLRESLAYVSCPVLLILGECDPLIPWQISSCAKSLMDKMDVKIITGASHAPFLSHPQRSVEHIAEFLRGPE